MSKLDEIEETPRQKAQNATATTALTEVVNEGESPNLEAMPRADTLVIWESFEQQVNRLKTTAETLKVENASQTAEIALARATRLQFKKLRVDIEHKRLELVSDLKARSGKIDKDAKKLKDICETLEGKLLADEQFIERVEEARKQALRDERVKTLLEYGSDGTGFQLGDMAQEAFDALVNSLRQLRDDKIKASKDEEDRIAKEKADALAEQERVRLENERLQQESKDREIAAETEKVRKLALSCARKKMFADAGMQISKGIFDSFGEMGQEEFELYLRDEYSAKEKREEAEAERQRLQKKIDDDAKAAEAKRAADKKIADKKAADLKAEADKLQAQLDEQKRASDKKKSEEEAAEAKRKEDEEKAKRAPDKEKILDIASSVRRLEYREVQSAEAKAIILKIESQAEKFAAWIEKEAASL